MAACRYPRQQARRSVANEVTCGPQLELTQAVGLRSRADRQSQTAGRENHSQAADCSHEPRRLFDRVVVAIRAGTKSEQATIDFAHPISLIQRARLARLPFPSRYTFCSNRRWENRSEFPSRLYELDSRESLAGRSHRIFERVKAFSCLPKTAKLKRQPA
jgi:hypothetical protein